MPKKWKQPPPPEPTRPRPNDVLLGRGRGPNLFEGNVRFRGLVNERKEKYLGAVKHKKKQKIAQELATAVHASGGRFLCLCESEQAAEGSNNIVSHGTWIEAECKVAIEKCKQSLRENREKKKKSKKRKTSAIEVPFVQEEDQVPEPPIVSSAIEQNAVRGFEPLPPNGSRSSDTVPASISAETHPESLELSEGMVETPTHPPSAPVSPDVSPLMLPGHNMPLHIMQRPQWGIHPFQYHSMYHHNGTMESILNDRSSRAPAAFSLPPPPRFFPQAVPSHHAQMMQANASFQSGVMDSSILHVGARPPSNWNQHIVTEMEAKPEYLLAPPHPFDLEDIESSLGLDGEDLNEETNDGDVSEFLLSALL